MQLQKSITFLIFLNLLPFNACGWRASKSLTEAERRKIAEHVRRAIERTGGTDVWVKGPPNASVPLPRVDIATEVLATPAAFGNVLSAMERKGQEEGLQIKMRVFRSRDRWRVADLRLRRDRRPAGRWLLREVGQIRRAAIVIDDLGQDMAAVHSLLTLPYPITFSVLPHLSHSALTAEEVHQRGREVMLHLPMEPDSPARPGKGEIRVEMRPKEVERTLLADLASVPYVAGVNNHMGSRATTNPALMASVLRVLAEHRLYFVDSRTTPQSVAFDVARREGLRTFYRSVFLDDTETVPYTLGQLQEFRRLIDEQGAALAIGHPYPTTRAALARFLPEFERSDIQLVPASELLRLPEVARLEPPRPSSR